MHQHNLYYFKGDACSAANSEQPKVYGVKLSQLTVDYYVVKVLVDTKKVAVGKVVLKDKEHLVVIRLYQKELIMHILHYLEEIRPADEIPELKEMQRINLADLVNFSFAFRVIRKYTKKT